MVTFRELTKTNSMKKFKLIIFALGVILLAINVLGSFKTLRNPDIYTQDSKLFKSNADIKYEDILREINRKENESDKEFAIRVNDLIYRGMLYYWHIEGIKKYNLKVPIWENYILSIRNSLRSIDRYEFKSWEKNLERGVGLCSAYSNVLEGILIDNGVEARIWGLTRHVIVEAKVSENEWYVLDPNYGLVIPHSMEEIKDDPELVRSTYLDMADLHVEETYKDPYTTDLMVEVFGYNDNSILSPSHRFERFSYIAIWVLPLLLIFVGGLLVYNPLSTFKN